LFVAYLDSSICGLENIMLEIYVIYFIESLQIRFVFKITAAIRFRLPAAQGFS